VVTRSQRKFTKGLPLREAGVSKQLQTLILKLSNRRCPAFVLCLTSLIHDSRTLRNVSPFHCDSALIWYFPMHGRESWSVHPEVDGNRLKHFPCLLALKRRDCIDYHWKVKPGNTREKLSEELAIWHDGGKLEKDATLVCLL
jgi:hypothetical protein